MISFNKEKEEDYEKEIFNLFIFNSVYFAVCVYSNCLRRIRS